MSDEQFCFVEQQRETSVIARGARGMTHGYRPKRPRLPFSGPIADMTIHRNGREILVPAIFFTQDGKIKKSCQVQYYELLSTPTEECRICEGL